MRTRLETENWKLSPYTQYLGLRTWMSSSRNQINQKREDSPDLGSKVFQHEEVKPKRWSQSRKSKRSGQRCKRGTPQRVFKMGGQPCQTSLRWEIKGRLAMSDIAEMGNTRKTERMLRAEETEGLQKPCNLLGLRKITSTRVLLISHATEASSQQGNRFQFLQDFVQ